MPRRLSSDTCLGLRLAAAIALPLFVRAFSQEQEK
jgi:hypothetical protein